MANAVNAGELWESSAAFVKQWHGAGELWESSAAFVQQWHGSSLTRRVSTNRFPMPIPDADRAIVATEMVRDDLLNLEHLDGGSKAVWFHSVGYARDQWQRLAELLHARRTA